LTKTGFGVVESKLEREVIDWPDKLATANITARRARSSCLGSERKGTLHPVILERSRRENCLFFVLGRKTEPAQRQLV
jgi:hypothetical protein